MSRRALLLLVVAACGKSAHEKEAEPVVPAADARPPDARPIDATPIGLGWLDGRVLAVAAPTARHDAPPLAVVVIDADGALHVMASGGSWDALARKDPAAAPPVTLDALAPAVLDVLDAVPGPAAEQAQVLRAELAAVEPDEPCDDCERDEEDVVLTYASADPLPPATPLIVVHPDAPAFALLAVLDAVGGAIAIAVDGALAIEALGYPWANGGWGGADVDQEARSLDLALGRDLLAIGAAHSPNSPVAIVEHVIPVEAVRFDLGDLPEWHDDAATIDVLVTPEATAGNVVDAVRNLAFTARTIGVGRSPWPMRTR